MNVTRPSGRTPRVAGLATSCRSAPKPQRLAARELVRERLVEHGAQRAARAPPKTSSSRPSSSIWLRAAPRACGRTRRGGGSGSAPRRGGRASSGSTARQQPQPVGQLEARRARRAPRSGGAARAKTRSGEASRHPRRRRAREPLGRRRRARSRARRRGAPGAAAAAGRPRRRPPPSTRRTRASRSAAAAVRVDQLAARRAGRAIAFTREVAPGEVRPRSSSPWSGGHVVAAAGRRGRARARRRTPRTAGTRGRRARRATRARGRLGVAGHRHVHVARPAGRAARRATVAAHDPGVGVAAPQRPGDQRGRSPRVQPAHPRGEPAGDLVVDRAEPRRHLLGEDPLVRPGAPISTTVSPTSTSVSGPERRP